MSGFNLFDPSTYPIVGKQAGAIANVDNPKNMPNQGTGLLDPATYGAAAVIGANGASRGAYNPPGPNGQPMLAPSTSGLGSVAPPAQFNAGFVAPPTNLWSGIQPGGPPPPPPTPPPAAAGLGSVVNTPAVGGGAAVPGGQVAPQGPPGAQAFGAPSPLVQSTAAAGMPATDPRINSIKMGGPAGGNGLASVAPGPQATSPTAGTSGTPGGTVSQLSGSQVQGQPNLWFGGNPNAPGQFQAGYQNMGNTEQTALNNQAGQALGTTAPTVATGPANAYAGMANQGMTQQQQATGLLAQAAQGNTPSAADISMQQGIAASARAQLAAAASARGGAYGQEAAQQQASQNIAGQQSQGVGQAAALRAQEMATAQQAYVGASAQQTGAAQQSQAQAAQQAQAQAALQAQQNQINNTMALGSETLGSNANLAYQGMGMGVMTQQLGAQEAQQGMAQQAALANAAQAQSGTNALIGAGSNIGAALLKSYTSDINAKQGIQPQGAAPAAQFTPPPMQAPAPPPQQSGYSKQDVLALLQQMRANPAPEVAPAPPPIDPSQQPAQVPNITSDERTKEGGDGAQVADSYLEALARSKATYSYKDPSQQPTSSLRPPDARYGGVMAQALERVPEIGQQLVTNTPRGKALEGGANLSAALMGLGRLAERVKALEGTSGTR
jgi:hypothetical protein